MFGNRLNAVSAYSCACVFTCTLSFDAVSFCIQSLRKGDTIVCESNHIHIILNSQGNIYSIIRSGVVDKAMTQCIIQYVIHNTGEIGRIHLYKSRFYLCLIEGNIITTIIDGITV